MRSSIACTPHIECGICCRGTGRSLPAPRHRTHEHHATGDQCRRRAGISGRRREPEGEQRGRRLARADQGQVRIRLVATTKTTTLQREISEAADAGLPDRPSSGKREGRRGGPVLMEKGAEGPANTQYRGFWPPSAPDAAEGNQRGISDGYTLVALPAEASTSRFSNETRARKIARSTASRWRHRGLPAARPRSTIVSAGRAYREPGSARAAALSAYQGRPRPAASARNPLLPPAR